MTGEVGPIASIDQSVDALLEIAQTQSTEDDFQYAVHIDGDAPYETFSVPFRFAYHGFERLGRGDSNRSFLSLHTIYAEAIENGLVLRRTVEVVYDGGRGGRELTVTQDDDVFFRHARFKEPIFTSQLKKLAPVAAGVGGLRLGTPAYAEQYAERMKKVVEACKGDTSVGQAS